MDGYTRTDGRRCDHALERVAAGAVASVRATTSAD
jgi:hypothetical protein